MHILTDIGHWVRAHAKSFGAGCAAMVAILVVLAFWFQPISRTHTSVVANASSSPALLHNLPPPNSHVAKPERLGFAITWLKHVQLRDDDTTGQSQSAISRPARASAVEMASRFALSTEHQTAPPDPADLVNAGAITGTSPLAALAPNAISARLDLARNRFGKARTAFPFQVTDHGPTPARGTIVVGQLPDGASFTSGTRTSEGAWHLAIPDLKSTQLVIGPSAPNGFMLSIIQLDPEGMVVNGIGIAVFLSDAEPLTVATQVRQTLSQRTKITTAGRYRAPRLVLAPPARKLPPLQGVTRPITASPVVATPMAVLPAQINQASPWPVPTLVPAPVALAPREVTDRALNPVYPFTEGLKQKP